MKVIYLCTVIICISLGGIASLYNSSFIGYGGTQKRNFVPSLSAISKVPCPISVSYFIGRYQGDLYLGDRTALTLWRYSKDTLLIPTTFTHPLGSAIHSSRFNMLYDTVILEDSGAGKLFIGFLSGGSLYSLGKVEPLTSETIPISSSTAIIRVLQKRSLILARQTFRDGKIDAYPTILEPQVDSIFSVDGILHYNPEMLQLVYVYHYRNAFITMDTSLQQLNYYHTIDTVSRVNFTIDPIQSDRSVTFSTPPLFVNLKSVVAEQSLYIHSGIGRMNAGFFTSPSGMEIDVYDLETGAYTYSFHLPDFDGKRVLDFTIAAGVVYALYRGMLVCYQLPPLNH